MRAFVAVDLPERLADAVAAVQADLPDSLRRTDPGQAHVTLQFLGDVDPDRTAAVEAAVADAVEAASTGPFEVAVEGLGVFPSLDYISVVWLGVGAGSAELTRLHEAVERETTRLGFDRQEEAFTPHVTVARMDDARGKAAVRELVRETTPRVGRFTAEAVWLKRSRLAADGAEHEPVARVPL